MSQEHRRKVTRADSKGKTFVIPKGDICVTSPSVQHRLNGYFTNADEYDHTRFLPPRSEDKAAKFTFIGFGGGRHGCMGTNFAYLQIKTVCTEPVCTTMCVHHNLVPHAPKLLHVR
jgi:cytochrome P450